MFIALYAMTATARGYREVTRYQNMRLIIPKIVF